MSSEKLRILPLGGLGEIGMNCLVLEWMDEMVLVDCGIQFPDASYGGVDLLTPDLSYVRDRLSRLRGIVITHGHDDHIGAIPFLARDADMQVHCTKFPEGLLRQKLSEFGELHEVRFHEVKPRQTFQVGPFRFDPIPVQHSIIESLAYAIETPVGTLIHTGDFKHDANEVVAGEKIDFEPFAEYGKRGVLMLLSDSTNAERSGHTLSELDIARSFEQILSQQNGRILVALFASNIRRIEKILGVAKKLGKKVALAGRSMHSYTKLAHENSSLDIPSDTLVLLENIGGYHDDEVVVLLTGSQAEPQSALIRVAQGVHKDLEIRGGDRIILSSRFIPGNERSITSMIDQLYRAGAEVTYESFHQIHVSGHGHQEELLMMLKAAKPKYFVPLHGEYRHLSKHANLARSAGVDPDKVFVIEDGHPLDIDDSGVARGVRLELQKGVVVDGTYMEGQKEIFTQRSNLGKTGIVFAALIRDRKTRALISNPKIFSHGLLFRKELNREVVFEEASGVARLVYEEAHRREDLGELLRLELRRFFKKRVSHKPVVIPVVIEV